MILSCQAYLSPKNSAFVKRLCLSIYDDYKTRNLFQTTFTVTHLNTPTNRQVIKRTHNVAVLVLLPSFVSLDFQFVSDEFIALLYMG